MKKVPVKIKNIEKLEFELCDSGNKGDYICLNDIVKSDQTKLLSFKNETVTKMRLDIKQEFETKKLPVYKKNWENEFFAENPRFINLQTENKKLTVELEKLKTNQETKIINEKLKAEGELNKRVNAEVANKIQIALKSKDEEISRIKAELAKREGWNSKVKGEELEHWLKAQFEDQYAMNSNLSINKLTRSAEHQKYADFIIKIYDSEHQSYTVPLTQILVEAKTGKTQKNQMHFDKLARQCESWKAEFGILITELEPEDKFYIRKIKGFANKNLYMARPEFFIPFVEIIKVIIEKRKKTIRDEIHYFEKEKILNDFNNFKNNILDNSLKNLHNQLLTIQDSNTKIITLTGKIDQTVKKAINTHIETIKNKIKNFKINSKVTKPLNKLQEESY